MAFIAYLVHLFARAMVPFMRHVDDLPAAERIGIDQPRWFERVLMAVFPYREITKWSGPQQWIYHGNGVASLQREHWILYLRRFFLTSKCGPLRVFLHHIVMSDNDRDPHDHPGDFETTIAKGSYREFIDLNPDGSPADIRLALPGMCLSNPAEHLHKVEVIEPVWSIVVFWRAKRIWGFQTSTGWVPWRKYLGLPDNEPDSPEDVIT